MPQRKNIHIDVALSNLAQGYRNLAFVADFVFPILPVKNESDKYYIFNREEMREVDTHRAIGAESNEVEWDVSDAAYLCEEYALSKLIADRTVNNADSPIRPKATTINKIMKWIQLGHEKRVMNLVTGGGVSGSIPTIKWDETSATIEDDIDTAKASISLNAGVIANRLLMNDQVKDVFKKDSTIRNLIRYTIQGNGGQELLVNGELPPVVFGLKTVVAGSAENTAKEGATDVVARIWPDDVLVSFVEEAPDLQACTLGYTFMSQAPQTISWRVDSRKGNKYEVSLVEDERLIATAAGYLLDNVLK